MELIQPRVAINQLNALKRQDDPICLSSVMLAPLSGSEKLHAVLSLIGPNRDGRISSLMGSYAILSALGFVPENKADRGRAARQG
jgi:hypothetical protein